MTGPPSQVNFMQTENEHQLTAPIALDPLGLRHQGLRLASGIPLWGNAGVPDRANFQGAPSPRVFTAFKAESEGAV